MPLAKRKTVARQAAGRQAAGRRHGRRTEHRIADALERIADTLERIADRQDAITMTQPELDELYHSATSSVMASDALQARLKQAMSAGKPQV